MKLVVPAIISLLLLSSIGHSQSNTFSPSSVDSLSNKTIVGNSNRISAVCVSPACSYMPGTPDFFLDSGSSYTGTAQTFLLDVGLNGYVFQGNGVSQTVGFLNSRLYNQATANGVIGNGAVATTVEAANTGTCSFCYSSLKAINQGGHLAELVVTAPSFNNNGVSYLPQGPEGEAAFLAIDGGLPFAIGDRNNGAWASWDNSGNVTFFQHVLHGRTNVPTAAGCGTSPAIAGSDNAMLVTVGTGGTANKCSVLFAQTWPNPPICIAQNNTDRAAYAMTTTATSLTISADAPFTASSKLHVHCTGY